MAKTAERSVWKDAVMEWKKTVGLENLCHSARETTYIHFEPYDEECDIDGELFIVTNFPAFFNKPDLIAKYKQQIKEQTGMNVIITIVGHRNQSVQEF